MLDVLPVHNKLEGADHVDAEHGVNILRDSDNLHVRGEHHHQAVHRGQAGGGQGTQGVFFNTGPKK